VHAFNAAMPPPIRDEGSVCSRGLQQDGSPIQTAMASRQPGRPHFLRRACIARRCRAIVGRGTDNALMA